LWVVIVSSPYLFLVLLHLLQTQTELLVCKGNIPAVPALVPCVGTAEEQDRAAVGIKGKQYAHRIAFDLDSQLLHVLMRGALNVINPAFPN
jgi:hypothetical protein